MNFDLGHVARDLGIPLDKIQRTVQMLDEGNTVPFITRYRKDQTGGLDEEAIRHIQDRVAKMRLLVERKQTILKSIEAQGKLTPELANQINSADSIKRLEDLYLPFKPKKQTLATKAREQGLEPLALEILNADPAAQNLEARLAEFVSPDNGLANATDVLQGIGYLVAEKFSERADVRGRLRRILWRTGKLVCTRIEPTAEKKEEATEDAPVMEAVARTTAPDETASKTEELPAEAVAQAVVPDAVVPEAPAEPVPAEEPGIVAEEAAPATAATAEESTETAASTTPVAAGPNLSPDVHAAVRAAVQDAVKTNEVIKAQRKKKKKKKKEQAAVDAAFKDYFQYQEPLQNIPPHRVLAINRGERAKVLRVKVEVDQAAMYHEAEPLLVPAEHPHAEFLRTCLQDALGRLIEPSLEREARREMTEKSEIHAVDVFIRNLKKLLLQAPVNGRRVLAVDPGFKSGCKLAALDEFGNVIGHAIIHVVGNEERRKKGREQIVEMIRSLELSVVAIGNGTACRETEQLIAEIIADEVADREVAYVIVNEAGASVYSTSPIGREEFPGYDPLLRSAISIGRRLLDPLSELVKINPANIGVGLYQHDVKAKHLRDSLDAVVESAVNYVGVDVNTASPALLRYVSGLNQLTARRLYEHRCEHGAFKTREELKQVAGFGDAAFVQSAGFLKILGGDNALDATWIHPESYEVAQKVLERLHSDLRELAHAVPAAPQPRKAAPLSKAVQQFASNLLEPGAGEAEATAAVPAEAEPADEVAAAQEAVAEVPPVVEPEVVAPAAEPVDPVTSETPATEPPPAPKGPSLAERAMQVDVAALATELQSGELLLRDILSSLMRPGRDPREDLPPPVFRTGIMKLEDLLPGMELQGTVLNVVDFGAFVDIGLSDSGLVHISRLADRYVRDPHEVVGVGDILKVWVVDVDKQRRRVSLTAIQPGTERPQPPKREKQPRGERPARPPRKPQGDRPPAAQGQGQGAPKAARPPKPATSAPPANAPPARPAFRSNMTFGGAKDTRGPAPTVGSKKMLSKQLKVKKKLKPTNQLTPEMEQGSEPMRSFSDLLQFVKKKGDGKDDKK